MPKGVVQFYLKEKCYGYIRQKDSLEEFYFTEKNCLEEVQSKDEVSFEVKETKQGLVAIDIKKLKESK